MEESKEDTTRDSRCVALVGGDAVLPNTIIPHSIVAYLNGTILLVDVDNAVSRQKLPPNTRFVDVRGKTISPGFIDVHVHGGGGADFMDGTRTAFRDGCLAHLRHGSTTLFPTTTTGSPALISSMLAACESVIEATDLPHIPGIHLYGPFFAADKVGCHSAAGRRNPDTHEYAAYFKTGLVKIATCAAELDGAQEFYRTALLHDCLITCGHSNSNWAEMQTAFDLGMRHVDHFWCAMSSVTSLRQRFSVPMQASMTEFVLMNDAMSTEVIADGQHLAPELLEFANRMIGADRLCLVTDCNRALDMPPGEYKFGHLSEGSNFISDGNVGWAPDGSSLASAVVGMDHMVRHMLNSTSATLPEVIRMASLTPATRTGIADQTGSLEAGKRADILVLDQSLNVRTALVAGRELYSR